MSTKSLKDLARDALAVQNACNLCGVAQSFARVMVALGDHTSGTDERNTHPIAILWSDKIASLTGTQSYSVNDAVTRAYAACRALADAPDES